MNKYSNDEIKDIIEWEGLSYSVTDYLGADAIQDNVLAGLWQDAADALAAIEDYLKEN